MLEDITLPRGQAIRIAATPDSRIRQGWRVWLLHIGSKPINHVLISAVGKDLKGQPQTTTLRRHWTILHPGDIQYVESLIAHQDVFLHLYLVSYWMDQLLYEQWLVFPAESLSPENLVLIPQLEKSGVYALTQKRIY